MEKCFFVIYTSLIGTFSPRAAVNTDLQLLYVSASYYQSPNWLFCTKFTQDGDFGSNN